MISEAEALQCIRSVALPSDRFEVVPLADALGQIAASSVLCQVPMPRFRSTSVDGYALSGGAHPKGRAFTLAGEQAAGLDRELTIGNGEAIRVFTGAPLPSGTTTVVMQEDVQVSDTDAQKITLTDEAAPGKFMREAGEDLCEGQRLLSPGDRLTAQRLSLLASQGLQEIAIRLGPRVAVFSTGNELVQPGQPLANGQIYESNGLMLRLLAEQAGASVVTAAHLPDDPDTLRVAIREAVATADMVLLSGGVSVGDHDHVRPVLQELGMTMHFWKVRVKPGKPLLCGQLEDCLVFGLPGNPASSFVSFLVFCLPAFRCWLGLENAAFDEGTGPGQRCSVVLSGRKLHNESDRPHYVRGRFDAKASQFEAIGLQQSHALQSLALANALARVPEHSRLVAGDTVEVVLF
jgi:molybdopterin molybdotransferase